MSSNVFGIDVLATIIFSFIPECQKTYWVECALFEKHPIVSDLMKWSKCLLNPIVFCACCKVGKFESLLLYHTRIEIGAWLSKQPKTQSFLLGNSEFKPIFVLLRDVTTWTVRFPIFVLDVLPFETSRDTHERFESLLVDNEVDILERVLNARSATKHQDSARIAELLLHANYHMRWTANMLHFLCGWSPIIHARIKQLAQTIHVKLNDEAALEAMYANNIWDKEQQRANFRHVCDFQTIAILFRPAYKLHPKHCAQLIDEIVRYHILSSETACALLQPLWMYEPDESEVEFLNPAFLNMLDPSSSCFRAMFPTPQTFLITALKHNSPRAIDWAIATLPLNQDDVNMFIIESLAKSDFFYELMNRMVKRWPRLPTTIITQLARYALTNWSWALLDVLIRQKHIDRTFVDTLSEDEWLTLANAPQHIVKLLWYDTSVWRKQHDTFFGRTLQNNTSTTAVLWRRNNNIDLNLLVEYACTLFCGEHWDILGTVVATVPAETIMLCYKYLALMYSDAKCAFLERNWPLHDPNEWIKLAQVGCEQFWIYCLKSGRVSCEHLLVVLMDNEKCCKFLRTIHFDLDFHTQICVSKLDACFRTPM